MSAKLFLDLCHYNSKRCSRIVDFRHTSGVRPQSPAAPKDSRNAPVQRRTPAREPREEVAKERAWLCPKLCPRQLARNQAQSTQPAFSLARDAGCAYFSLVCSALLQARKSVCRRFNSVPGTNQIKHLQPISSPGIQSIVLELYLFRFSARCGSSEHLTETA
jgi:hypothetical protein